MISIEVEVAPELIELTNKKLNKKDIFEIITNKLYRYGCIKNQQSFLESIYYRERLLSTYCNESIAIPHGISNSVIKPSICYFRTDKFIDWDGNGKTPVKTVFLIAIPKGNMNEYILILSKIANLVMDKKAQYTLSHSNDKEDISTVIKGYIYN